MNTIKELNKEKLLIRAADPERASALGMIIDGAQKAAKSDQREVEDKDLVNSVKKLIKETEKAMELIESKGGDATKWKQELVIYKQYLPKQRSEDQTREIINLIIPATGGDKKSRGKIMAQLKEDSSIDMSIASKILDEVLV
jgi:uncharacterized protein YqeY